jgi:hypothetical protein
MQFPHAFAEPGASHNEGRAVLVDDSVVGWAALMCELGRSASLSDLRLHYLNTFPQYHGNGRPLYSYR